MSNQVVIVDQKDHVIGQMARSSRTHTDISRVAALWLTNSRGDVLLAQRQFTKDRSPGKWGPAVAGTIEVGESYDTNVYKEAEEEIGLTGVRFRRGRRLFVETARHRYYCQWFTATVDWEVSQFRLQDEEVAGVAWVPREVLAAAVESRPSLFTASAGTWLELFLP